MKHYDHINEGIDCKLKKLLIVKQILLVSKKCIKNSMENLQTDIWV